LYAQFYVIYFMPELSCVILSYCIVYDSAVASCIWGVAVYGSETWTVGTNEERVVNAFETWSWRGMLK